MLLKTKTIQSNFILKQKKGKWQHLVNIAKQKVKIKRLQWKIIKMASAMISNAE